jgi:hypothetical protein
MRVNIRKIIILTISTFFTGAVVVIGMNPEYDEALEYGRLCIKYKQYVRETMFSYTGNSATNQELLDQAYMRLANKLLDEYLKTNDSQLLEKVVELNDLHNLRYPRKRYTMKEIDVDSLIRDRDRVLDTVIWRTD